MVVNKIRTIINGQFLPYTTAIKIVSKTEI